MEPLITYIEKEAILENIEGVITYDYLNLLKTFEEVAKHVENVEQINNDG